MLARMESNDDPPFEAATTVEHSPEANDAPRLLEIEGGTFDAILGHLRAWLPNEGCGLLASVRDGAVDRAVHFFPGTNIDVSPVRFTMDPVEVIGAMKRMRDEDWNLAAIVHSHPRTAPVPSRTDRQEWYYPQARLMIVSFEHGDPEFGCWGLAGDGQTREFRQAPIRISGR